MGKCLICNLGLDGRQLCHREMYREHLAEHAVHKPNSWGEPRGCGGWARTVGHGEARDKSCQRDCRGTLWQGGCIFDGFALPLRSGQEEWHQKSERPTGFRRQRFHSPCRCRWKPNVKRDADRPHQFDGTVPIGRASRPVDEDRHA